MRKYLIVIILIILAGITAYVLQSENNRNQREGHHQPVTQSHRSYSIQFTSSAQNIVPGSPAKVSFKIINDKGEAVKDFSVAHEKLLHLIVVRKDLQDFQHLHPNFDSLTGEFTVSILFPSNGPFRIFTDFTPGTDNPQKLPVALNHDFTIGDVNKYTAMPVVPDTASTKSVKDYEIIYDFPKTLPVQTPVQYSLAVKKAGENITLEPYLGAMGHSVILRADTLDYIHTHAEGMEHEDMQMNHQQPGNIIAFSTTFPAQGKYKTFTEFQHKGKVTIVDYVVSIK